MTYLRLAAHLFLLLLWTRLWVKPEREFYFNPFLSGATRLMDSVVGFLRPALMLPDRLTALVLLLLFWVFQTIFFAQFGGTWNLSLGLIHFTPPSESLAWGMQFAYSGLHSAHVLLQMWTLYFFVRLITPPNRTTRAQEAFTFFMNPFSRLPLLAQPVVLLALHFALLVVVIRIGAIPFAVEDIVRKEAKAIPELFTGGHILVQVLKTGWLTMLSFTNGLQTLIWTLIFFLLGGMAMMLFGANLPTIICRESVDVLLGRFARNPTSVGGFDFTPMFFVIVVSLLSGQLQATLYSLILMPMPGPLSP